MREYRVSRRSTTTKSNGEATTQLDTDDGGFINNQIKPNMWLLNNQVKPHTTHTNYRADKIFKQPSSSYQRLSIVFIDEVEGVNRRITDEAGGRVCNPTISPRHRGDK